MIGIFQARGVIVISKAFSPHDVVRLCHSALKFVLVPDAKEFIIMIDNRELSTGCVFNVKAEAEKYVSMNGYSLLSRYIVQCFCCTKGFMFFYLMESSSDSAQRNSYFPSSQMSTFVMLSSADLK